MSMNEWLYEQAKKAVTNLFNDNSVSVSDCRRNLQALKDEIDVMLESLGEDDADLEYVSRR